MKNKTMSLRGVVLALLAGWMQMAWGETFTVSGTALNRIENGQFVYRVDGVGTFVISGDKALSYGNAGSWPSKPSLKMPTGTYSLTCTAAAADKIIKVNSGSLTGASNGAGSTLKFGTGSTWMLKDMFGATYTVGTGTADTFAPLAIEAVTSQVNIKSFTLTYELVDRVAEAELDDRAAYDATQHVYCDRLTLQRTFKAGWNTVCLPFAFAPALLGEGAVAQQFVSYDAESGLAFEIADEMEANRPYLVYCPAEVPAGLTVEGVELMPGGPVAVTQNGLTFRGNYEPGFGMEGKYGVAHVDGTDRIRKGSAAAWINGLRAYFEPESGVEVKASLLLLEGQTATGVETVDSRKAQQGLQAPFCVYTVGGVCVRRDAATLSGLPGGLYVVNGRKVVLP